MTRPMEFHLLIAVATRIRANGDHIVPILQNHVDSGILLSNSPGNTCTLVHTDSLNESLATIRRHLAGRTESTAVLISDMLVEQAPQANAPWTSTEWAQQLRTEFNGHYCAIAIMDSPKRVADIDRTIGCNCDAEKLLETLGLVIEKLRYTGPVEKFQLADRVDIRMVHKSHELLESLKLRHRVYRAMGYLDESVEHNRSKLEMDWCDTISRHIGAFLHLSGHRRKLIGTSRLVIADGPRVNPDNNSQRRFRMWLKALAANDEVLQGILFNRVLSMQLPFFHSQLLTKSDQHAMVNEQCAELSRVVVDADYRGAGISLRLIQSAISEAQVIGIDRMYLECLDIHEKLYRRFGFIRRIGDPKEVIGINKTMIAMELKMQCGTFSRTETGTVQINA